MHSGRDRRHVWTEAALAERNFAKVGCSFPQGLPGSDTNRHFHHQNILLRFYTVSLTGEVNYYGLTLRHIRYASSRKKNNRIHILRHSSHSTHTAPSLNQNHHSIATHASSQQDMCVIATELSDRLVGKCSP